MSTKLNPVVCQDETAVMDTAYDGVRRRPVVAINDQGQLVVCCRSTARKRGWQLEAKLFQRASTPKDPAELPKPPVPSMRAGRCSTDAAEAVVVPKAKVLDVKNVIDAQIMAILGAAQ